MSRFTLTEAKRGALPLFIGLAGPTGGGKTFSALRLATGIQRVAGGKIAYIDTEANRALHYAEMFKFDHLPFSPPFSPSDYGDAIDMCVQAGAKTIVIDSMSHEHEGPGGILEWHAAEVERLMQSWRASADKVQFPAWSAPKAARTKLVQHILQLHINLICCFRAKKKTELPKKGSATRELVDLGWMPIGGADYYYEMTALGVLPPGAKGVPDWSPIDPGSDMVTKRPIQFEAILKPGAQLSEEMGEAMARWALGAKADGKPKTDWSGPALSYLDEMKLANTKDQLVGIREAIVQDDTLTAEETQKLEAALKKRTKQLEARDA